MSLESSIGALVARGDALMNLYTNLETFTQGRIAAVAAAFAASANGTVWVYVDPVNGVDATERAGTQAQPLKTIEAALARTPIGGFCYLSLMGAITISNAISIRGKSLLIVSSSATRHALNFVPAQQLIGATNYRKMPGFNIEAGGNVILFGLTIIMPPVTGFEAVSTYAQSALFQVQNDGFVIMPSASIVGCDVNLPATPFCPLVSQPSLFALIVKSVVLTGSPLTGRVIFAQGDTATSQPASNFKWLFTNLATV